MGITTEEENKDSNILKEFYNSKLQQLNIQRRCRNYTDYYDVDVISAALYQMFPTLFGQNYLQSSKLEKTQLMLDVAAQVGVVCVVSADELMSGN